MDLKNLQRGIALISAIIGIVTLLASIIYDYFFFLGSDLAFYQIPFSFSDITQTFLSWLPYALLNVVIIALCFWLYFPGGKFHGSVSLSKQHTFIYCIAWIVSSISILVYVLFGDAARQSGIQGLILFLILITLSISKKISDFMLRYENFKNIGSFKINLTVYYTIVFFVLIGYHGYYDSLKLRAVNPPSAVITVSSGQVINTNIVRMLDKGVIIGIKNKPLDFVPWTVISNVRSIAVHQKYKGILCAWFNFLCQQKQESN